jgi:hypothetical protein
MTADFWSHNFAVFRRIRSLALGGSLEGSSIAQARRTPANATPHRNPTGRLLQTALFIEE